MSERSMLRVMHRESIPVEAVEALPLGRLREALGAAPAYLVGGAARALSAGVTPDGDLDVAVEGDLEPVLARLGVPARRHARFETATVELNGASADLARTRTERYSRPGALPDVEPARIDADLARRDFTVNALAIAIAPPHELLDPFDGREDLRRGLLRVLHPRSFEDDPTRAIRAARYCARLGLGPEPETLALLRAADLGTVSADRRSAELGRLAAEPAAARGFELLAKWGVVELDAAALRLIAAVDRLATTEPWSREPGARERAILLATAGGDEVDRARTLAGTAPERPSQAVALAAGHEPAELLLAAAAGCGWLDRWAREWRWVSLAIDGQDLLAAGIPEGPAVGIGLRGALERKLDGELGPGDDRDAELGVAVEIARRAAAEI